MATSKFFTVHVKPLLPMATQIEPDKTDMVFGAGDVLFDWHAFQIPRGAAKLTDINTFMRGSQTEKTIDVYFARTFEGKAPGSIGTGNASADGKGYYKNLCGVMSIPTGDWKEDLSNIHAASCGHGAGSNQSLTMVLEGEPHTGDNVGYDTLYIAATVGAGSGWNYSTGVLANANTDINSASTFVTKTVDPRLFFDEGDTVHVHDSETAIGTVQSLTDNDIILTANNKVAIAANDEIMNAHPIHMILSFER